ESVWIALALDPTDGTLLGLRRDGKISGGSSPPVTPPAVDAGLLALPFPSNSDLSAAFNQLNSATKLNDNRYVSLKVDSAGTFLAVRGNGQIFSTASVVTPLVDLPSNGDPAINSLYQDVVVKGTDFWTVRWDGNIYSGLDTVPVLKTPGERFRDIELSDVVPDLTVFKNPVPIAMTYTATVIEHDAVNLPVIVSDIEKSADQLVVTAGVPKKPLPPGLSADPDSDPLTPPVITWNDATPKGTYTVPIVVDDGHNKPKTYNFKVKVILPDTNELKNKKPVFSTVKHTQALVGFPFTLQLFAVDPDEGDTVTLSVDTSKAPFNHLESPALFTADPGTGTGTFTWTPTFDDIGTTQVKFTATDSNATKPLTKTYTVKVKVVSSFLIPPG
ncbi:MAG TPA: putative Ig domain-containing protein, partial [Planctomycetota bacterium]|nr:putative Ig domain-containing protein [Planctomycetota bacterium]